MKHIFLCVALAVWAAAAYGAEPALTLEGAGTQNSPYLIQNAADVQALASACNSATTSSNNGHYKGKYFAITADIDMTGVKDFLGIGTAPAGVKTSYSTFHFDGFLDGRGHRIKNMVINGVVRKDDGTVNTSTTAADGARRYVGFIGALSNGGTVSNLIIDASCRIECYSNVGAVAGYIGTDCYVTGCANFAEVVAYDGAVGGIVGQQSTTSTKKGGVTMCFNAGTVRANGSEIGGIVGKTSYGVITNCVNVGQVIANQFDACKGAFLQTKAGGMTGYASYTKITDCFNAGDVYAMKESAGGIAGVVAESSTGVGGMASCLNVGYVYGALGYNCGYIAALNNSSSSVLHTVSNVYYDAQMSNTLFGADCQSFTAQTNIKGLPTAQLTSGQTLAGLEGWVYKAGSYPVPAGFDYAELTAAAATYLNIPAGQDADLLTGSATASTGTAVSLERPTTLFTVSGNTVTAHPSKGNGVGVFKLVNGGFTRHLLLSTYSIPFSGSGTEASPYLISNKADLLSLASLSNNMRLKWTGKHFRLTADIDLSNETGFPGIGCSPDTVNNFGPSYRLQFRGNFNGDNHKIMNWTLNGVTFDSDSNYIDWRKGGYYSNGFFGTLGQGAVVRNLIIDPSCTYNVYFYSGGIATMTRGDAVIDNCHVGATVNMYNRYFGGIVAYDNPSMQAGLTGGSVKISNCSFSGKILADYDYVGGIIGFSTHEQSSVTNCVFTGSIEARPFCLKTLGSSSTSTLNRIGGIAGAMRGVIENCASYGPITVHQGRATASVPKYKASGVGGIAGQFSNYSATAAMRNCFSSSQVQIVGYTGENDDATQVGALLGDFFSYKDTKNKTQYYGQSAANFCDTTLCATRAIVGTYSNVPDSVTVSDRFHGMATSAYVKGVALDSLSSVFAFNNGYYPMLKGWADNADVKAAASTFFNIGVEQGGSIRNLRPGAICRFNTVMPLTGSLENGSVFYIKDNALKMRNVNETANDVLTLTNGRFFTFYPIHKDLGTGVCDLNNDATDPIVSTVYYSTEGLRIANPQRGTTVIAISRTQSGRTIANKLVIK